MAVVSACYRDLPLGQLLHDVLSDIDFVHISRGNKCKTLPTPPGPPFTRPFMWVTAAVTAKHIIQVELVMTNYNIS